jgi:hypothetical protein
LQIDLLLAVEATIVSAGATVSSHGDDLRTATQLVAANLEVAVLPTRGASRSLRSRHRRVVGPPHFRERPAVRLTT